MLLNLVNSPARCDATSTAINWRMEKELEDWQIADAARLKRLFEEKADKSQQAFGLEHEIGTQGMVWQYLNARRALNLDALLKFAYGLKVPVEQISPTLSKKINLALQCANQGAIRLSTAGPDTPEGQVLHAMQTMDSATKYKLIQITQTLAAPVPEAIPPKEELSKEKTPKDSVPAKKKGKQKPGDREEFEYHGATDYVFDPEEEITRKRKSKE